MFCANCGKQLPENYIFCPECGTRVEEIGRMAEAEENQGFFPMHRGGQVEQGLPPYDRGQGLPSYTGGQRFQEPLPGYSPVFNTPGFQAAIKRFKKATFRFGLIVVPLPLVGFVLYSLAEPGKMNLSTAIMSGAFVSLIFLLCALVPALYLKFHGTWDGVVVDKLIREEQRSSNDHFTEDIYYTIIRKDKGGTNTIEEKEMNHVLYDYFQIGDRVRFHPELPGCPYEKYDKRGCNYVICGFCKNRVSLLEDVCPGCHSPVLK